MSLNLQISDLDLSKSTINALDKGGVKTVQDIVEIGYIGLLKIPNVGSASVSTISWELFKVAQKELSKDKSELEIKIEQIKAIIEE